MRENPTVEDLPEGAPSNALIHDVFASNVQLHFFFLGWGHLFSYMLIIY